MRPLALAVLILLSGCLGDGDGGDAGDRAGYRDGVVFFETDFTALNSQPAHFFVNVQDGARDVLVELQQDASALPDLRVRLNSCGSAELAGSTDWEKATLCDEAGEGRQEFFVELVGEETSGAIANGRVLLRADLPGTSGAASAALPQDFTLELDATDGETQGAVAFTLTDPVAEISIQIEIPNGAFTNLRFTGPGDCAAGFSQFDGSAVLVGPNRAYVAGTFSSGPEPCGALPAGDYEVAWSMDAGAFMGTAHVQAE